MTVNYICLMRQFFVLSEVCYMVSHDRALVANKYERKTIVIIKVNCLFVQSLP